jgi:hypothetical protein
MTKRNRARDKGKQDRAIIPGGTVGNVTGDDRQIATGKPGQVKVNANGLVGDAVEQASGVPDDGSHPGEAIGSPTTVPMRGKR